MNFRILLGFLLFIYPIIAAPSDCLYGILTALSEFTFNTSTADYYYNTCQDETFLESMYAAAKLYCSPDQINAGQAAINTTCTSYGLIHLVPYETVLPNLTDTFIASLPVVNFEDIGTVADWNSSILISPSLFRTGVDTEVWILCLFQIMTCWDWFLP